MLALIPILGPLIQGIATPLFNVIGQYFNTKVELAQTEAGVEKVETESSVNIIQATEGDWGIRLARDILIWPWALWSGAIGWDTLIAKTHPSWMLHPVAVPESVAYMPYAVIVFLLGNIGLNMWKRNG